MATLHDLVTKYGEKKVAEMVETYLALKVKQAEARAKRGPIHYLKDTEYQKYLEFKASSKK